MNTSNNDGLQFGEFLAHYGVKGMRWGVRRSPEELSVAVEKLRPKAEKAYEKYDKLADRYGKTHSKAVTLHWRGVDRGLTPQERHKKNRLDAQATRYYRKAEDAKKEYAPLAEKVNKLDKKIVARGERELKSLMKAGEKALKDHDGTQESADYAKYISTQIKSNQKLIERSKKMLYS